MANWSGEQNVGEEISMFSPAYVLIVDLEIPVRDLGRASGAFFPENTGLVQLPILWNILVSLR
jgi:hypothetical protein